MRHHSYFHPPNTIPSLWDQPRSYIVERFFRLYYIPAYLVALCFMWFGMNLIYHNTDAELENLDSSVAVGGGMMNMGGGDGGH